MTSSPSPTQILAALAAQGANVRRIVSDSRNVKRGDTFIACPGAATDGRGYIPQAIEAGATAVIWELADFDWDAAWRVPNVGVPGLRSMVGPIASEVFGNPSEALWIAGVTGTNGKTSTSQWIAQAIAATGKRAGVIGTLGIGLVEDAGGAALAVDPNTTPDPIVLQASLAGFRDAGASAAAMEVSSIGLDQGRVNAVAFDCAVFTNLTRDHLDYHGTMERYADAKARLFTFPTLSHVVLNLDDPVGVRLAASLGDGRPMRIGYSASGTAARVDCDLLLLARRVEYSPEGLRFTLAADGVEHPVATSLVGSFNVANVLAVCGALVAFGLEVAQAVRLLAGLRPVPGRMERVGGGTAPSVIVDYAHTPDALDKVLHAARELAAAGNGRLIAVFGCGGNRDAGKRPLMGTVAARLADRVILTSDNPRGESPEAILAEIEAGFAGHATPHEVVADRRAAIRRAVSDARAGDVIVLAGKGHEPYQEVAGVRSPFSDLAEARAALDAAFTVEARS